MGIVAWVHAIGLSLSILAYPMTSCSGIMADLNKKPFVQTAIYPAIINQVNDLSNALQ